MQLDEFLKILGTLTALVTAIFALKNLYKWLFPIHIQPGVHLSFVSNDEDEIYATITNRSNEPLYITSCSARGTYSLLRILKTHILNPLTKPRLYRNIRFAGASYDMLGNESQKIEPSQPIQLKHELVNHPLSAMHAPFFIVEVKLSSGRVLISKKSPTPGRWKTLGSARNA